MSIKLGSPEWREARRSGITGTDIPAILGISPFRSEGDVARDKYGIEHEPDPRSARRMRIGSRLEDVIRAEDEVEHGLKLRRVNRLMVHRDLPWAMASLDFERRDGTIVEAKSSRDRRWDDGLPPDVEAQVQWQLGVTGRERAHVVVLRYGSDLECYDLDARPDDFAGMIRVAQDFRRRLVDGGPFAESKDSIGRAYPFDSGAEIIADEELERLVRDFLEARAAAVEADERKDSAELAIKARMGDVATVLGSSWRVSWKQTKDRTTTDWAHVAESYRQLIDALGRDDLVDEANVVASLYTRTEPGRRPFIVRPLKG